MPFINNINIWNDTVNFCNNNLNKSNKSIKYDFTQPEIKKIYNKTYIEVINVDCIKCGIALKQKNYNPVILNLADDRFPGGHVQIGTNAQEESIFRRSNYYQTLNHETGFYPLKDSQLIYSPNVTVIKNENGNYLDKFYELAFIACPGIHNPELIDDRLNDKDVEILKNKIKNILNISYIYKHDIPILGAIGCGAWKCPPKHVAEIFKDVLNEYDGVFKHIVFAILDDKETIVKNRDKTESNYQTFKNILC